MLEVGQHPKESVLRESRQGVLAQRQLLRQLVFAKRNWDGLPWVQARAQAEPQPCRQAPPLPPVCPQALLGPFLPAFAARAGSATLGTGGSRWLTQENFGSKQNKFSNLLEN